MPHDHHDHSHEGLSPSGHPYRADNDTDLSYWQVMEIALRELLIEKGHLTAAQIHAQINAMDSRSPANGARVVARAWVDPEFKAALLDDAGEASRAMGRRADAASQVLDRLAAALLAAETQRTAAARAQ